MTEQTMVDPPDEFDALTQAKQAQLLEWVRVTLEPTKRIRDDQWAFSYALKHRAEKALGWYVSNGQLKGAMLAEGYRWEQCEGTLRRPNPNWVFNSRQRRGTRDGEHGEIPY